MAKAERLANEESSLGLSWPENQAEQQQQQQQQQQPQQQQQHQQQQQQQPRRVLFLGGGETTYQWGSFTVRGRQMARGLRALGLDARAWNSPCEAWCQLGRQQGAGGWVPTSFVHVKYVCECAVALFPSSVHVHDPVDIFRVSSAPLVDAVLVQTSLARADLLEHPPLQPLLRSERFSVHWLPIHHSNTHGLRIDPEQPVTRVGVHTVHQDVELEALISGILESLESVEGSPSGEGAAEQQQQQRRQPQQQQTPEFVHLDPSKLFEWAEGKVASPQQTDAVYQQLATLQTGAVRQSGCMSDWWFCSRWKTGQRLVNLLSVGVPTLVWGDAQGHQDVVQGLWPPPEEEEASLSNRNNNQEGQAPGRSHYPEQLVVSDSTARSALEALLSNTSLRQEAAAQGL
ncbi:unnamed protein product, partial [Polarella glacialis]